MANTGLYRKYLILIGKSNLEFGICTDLSETNPVQTSLKMHSHKTPRDEKLSMAKTNASHVINSLVNLPCSVRIRDNYSEDLSDVTDDVWLANRTSFRVRSLRINVQLTIADQN